jgi:hypothetical protein
MGNRTGNYCAFYVKEPFKQTNLGANTAKDFVYYRTLQMWKGNDTSFPFVDSHAKNYDVRDGSDWDATLKPRLRDRISKSKNIVLFLSSNTANSKALKEEIDYGINTKGLPVIVVYPEFKLKSDIINCDSKTLKKQVKDLWDKIPVFRDSMSKVPTIHIPNNKSLIEKTLKDSDFNVATKKSSGRSYYPC